jgi:hypothetical protein
MGRKSRWAWSVACLLALWASSGCGDPEHNDPGTGGTSSSGGATTSSGAAAGKSSVAGVDDFERSLWQAFCAQLFHCPVANDDDIGSKASIGTEERCVELVAEIQNRSPYVLDRRAKLASGAIRFVSDKVMACLAEARSCDVANARLNLTRSGRACRAVFEGSVPLGGACQRQEECAGDARCAVDQACPGQCVARSAPGQACDQASDCDETEGYVECRFNAATGTSSCVQVTIATPANEGQACAPAVPPLTTIVPCAAGLWCSPNAGTSTGTCRAPIAAGAPCTNQDDLCVDGTTCFDETSCKPLAVGARAGDPCTDTGSNFCDPFARLICVSGKCQIVGDGTLGSACSSSDIHELLDCGPGLRCAGPSPGRCAPLLTTGEACQSGGECVSGTCTAGSCASAFCERY